MPDSRTPLRPAVFHILLALAREELHGLGIAKAIDDMTQGSVRLGPGTLYRSLKEMARDGLIVEATPGARDGDPRRRYYRIAETGRDAVRAEAARMARIVDVAREARVLPGAR